MSRDVACIASFLGPRAAAGRLLRSSIPSVTCVAYKWSCKVQHTVPSLPQAQGAVWSMITLRCFLVKPSEVVL